MKWHNTIQRGWLLSLSWSKWGGVGWFWHFPASDFHETFTRPASSHNTACYLETYDWMLWNKSVSLRKRSLLHARLMLQHSLPVKSKSCFFSPFLCPWKLLLLLIAFKPYKLQVALKSQKNGRIFNRGPSPAWYFDWPSLKLLKGVLRSCHCENY